MINWFLHLERLLSERFGYDFVIHLEDFLLSAGSFSLGMMVMAVFSGNFLSKIKEVRQKRLEKIRVLDIKRGKKIEYILNAQTVPEFIETFLIILVKPLLTIKDYTTKDEKRTKIFIGIFLTIGFILIFLAIVSICTVFEPGIEY